MGSKYSIVNKAKWTCPDCLQADGTKHPGRHCERCKLILPTSAFDLDGCRNLYTACRACQHPPCHRCGSQRKGIWVQHKRARDSVPLCEKCERPPCDVCKEKERPMSLEYSILNQANWTCPDCLQADDAKQQAEGMKHSGQLCGRCKVILPTTAFDRRDGCRNLYTICRDCQHPQCQSCGTHRKGIWTPPPKARNPVPLCERCERKRMKTARK